MNDNHDATEPRMLIMHKTVTKTSDGTRPLTFYSFEAEPSTEHQASTAKE